MKKLILMVLLMSLASGAFAGGLSNRTFDRVSLLSRDLGFFGHDVVVCLGDKNTIRAGGFWDYAMGLQIFLAQPQRPVKALGAMKKSETRSNQNVEVFLHSRANLFVATSRNPARRSAILITTGGQQERLDCHIRRSGLPR